MLAFSIRVSTFFGVMTSLAHAQCANTWQPGTPIGGTNGPVNALAKWDPDGAGPLPEQLVVGGNFRVVGSLAVDGLALYDPATAQWSTLPPMGAQPQRYVKSLAVLPNGDLVVGMAGPTSSSDAIAFRWNGTAWSALGSGSGDVRAFAMMPNGDLIAGGLVTVLGAPTGVRLAKWNGTTWEPYTSDVNGFVNDLHVTTAGDLIVTGSFTVAGGVPAANIAGWNGISWSALGGGFNGGGNCLLELPNGDLLVGGAFSTAGGAPAQGVARWDGTSWSAIANLNTGATVLMLVRDASTGAVLMGGTFTSVEGVTANGLASWNGTSCSAFTTGVGGAVRCVAPLANGHVAIGGAFTTAGSDVAHNFVVWANGQWLAPGAPAPGVVTSLAVLGPGDVVAGGQLTFAGTMQFVGRWTNGVWSALGSGTDAPVNAVLAMPNGDIVAGGQFTTAGGATANRIARWNGTAWSPLGAGFNAEVLALARMPNGDIVAAGQFTSAGSTAANRIARWNGTTWSPLGSGLQSSFLAVGQGLVVMPNGDLVVTGGFATAGGVPATNVARWNGTAWSAMGAGIPTGFTSGTVTPNGDLVVAGVALGIPSPVYRWDGASWQPVTAPGWLATGLVALPDGDVLASAFFLGGQARVTRLHGTTWTDVAITNGPARTLAWTAGGEVFAGGNFTQIDGKFAPNIARLATSCPALAVASGAGCPSSGGANTLVATSRPWLGGTFATAGSGLPASALVAVVRGFAPVALPLVSALPQGQPGCALRVTPDLLDIVVPLNGAATASLSLPPDPSLVGQTFREQWVPLELGPGGAIVAVTSTNALTMTIGVF